MPARLIFSFSSVLAPISFKTQIRPCRDLSFGLRQERNLNIHFTVRHLFHKFQIFFAKGLIITLADRYFFSVSELDRIAAEPGNIFHINKI